MLPGELKDVHESAVWDKVILKESKWFTVNYPVASKILNDVYINYDKYTKKAQRQGIRNKEKFSYEQMHLKFKELVEKYIPAFAQEIPITLPKMELPKLNQEGKNETANAKV